MATSRSGPPDPDRQARVSLGSIPASQLRQHFIVFSISSLLMLAARVYNGVEVSGVDPTWHQIIDLIGEKAGSTMAACLGLSAIGVEGANMVLAELLKRQWAREASEAEARAEARNEARGAARMHRLWTEWLSRKEAAESRGEPFDEPPPQPENGTGRDT